MNSISNVEHGIKSEFYCTGCRFLSEEQFPKGQTALICTNEAESRCKSRVLGVFVECFIPTAREYILKPAWCKGGKYIVKEAAEI